MTSRCNLYRLSTRFELQEVDGLREAPTEGVYIRGLHLDGCGWSSKENKLVDSDAKRIYYQLPLLHVFGVQVSYRTILLSLVAMSRE